MSGSTMPLEVIDPHKEVEGIRAPLISSHSASSQGKMNSTEKNYARLLDSMGLVWWFEAVKLRLADKTFYTPDFMVLTADAIEMHEIKGGFFRDDARVKWKVAADQFYMFRWKWCVYKAKQWKVTEY